MIRGKYTTEKTEKTCKKCGKRIDFIQRGPWRQVAVDLEPVEVIADPAGEEFIRFDGSKVIARRANWAEETRKAEIVYRPHRCEGGAEQ